MNLGQWQYSIINMKSIFLTIVILVYDATVKSDVVNNSKAATTNVVNHEFCSSCLSEEENEWKDTLEEVQVYAELKNDPHADFPSSFTICSSVMEVDKHSSTC